MTEPVRLRIHPDPEKAVGDAVAVLSKWINIEHLRLGGGTALEARWHHRTTTDLDFFALGSNTDDLFYGGFENMLTDLRRFAADGASSKDGILVTARKIVHFVIRDTPVSFGRVDMFHNDPCDEAEHTTGVILSDTKDILAKKMFEPFSINQLVTERDAYDFIVARTEDPDALAYAWGTLTDDLRTNAKLAYRERAEGLDVSQYPGRPVENPRYEHIARDLWAHTSRMLDSDLAHAPALHPRDGNTAHGGGGHGR